MTLIIIFEIAGKSIQPWLRRAELRQKFALRPSTENNNRAVLNQFITFLRSHSIYFRVINHEIVCAYIEYVASRVKSPKTIRNYISAITQMYVRMDLDDSPFRHHKVARAMKATDNTVRHVVVPATMITPHILRKILYVISELVEFPTLKCAFVLMFMSMLRQSNFAAQSIAKFDITRQLTRGDIRVLPDGLEVSIKWEKNLQNMTNSTKLVLPRTSDISICPLVSFTAMCRCTPTRSEADPLLMFRNHRHMPLSFLNRIWRKAITKIGLNYKQARMHGLRRGGATFIASASQEARLKLKEYGRWRSTAYRKYISNYKACPVFEALKQI